MNTITISLPEQIIKRVDEEVKKLGIATRAEFISNLIGRYFKKEEIELETFRAKPIKQIRQEMKKTGKYNEKFITSVVEGLRKSSFYEG